MPEADRHFGRQSFPLLDVKIVVANGREPVSELGELFDGLVDPIGVQIESELQNIPKAAPSSLSFSVSEKPPAMVLLRYPAWNA